MLKKLLIFAICFLFLSSIASGAWTYIGTADMDCQGLGDTCDCSTDLNVAAGDLLVATAVWYDVNTTVLSIKEVGGGNDMTLLARQDNDMYMVFGYKINATADADATIRMTLNDNATYKFITVMQFRPDGGETVTLEDSDLTATGTGQPVSSNNITVNGDDILIVGGSANSGWATLDTEKIAEGVADGTVDNIGGASTMAGIWYTIFNSNQTNVDADATLTDGKPWVCQIIGFKSASTGDGEESAVFFGINFGKMK